MVHTYTVKNSVTAVELKKTPESVKEVVEFVLLDGKYFNAEKRQFDNLFMGPGLTLDTGKTLLNIKFGDYVVKDIDGDFHAYSMYTFDNLYELANQ